MKITITTATNTATNNATLATARAAHKAAWEAATDAHNAALAPFQAAVTAADKIFAAAMEAADEAVTTARQDHADMARAIAAAEDAQWREENAAEAQWEADREARWAALDALHNPRHCAGNDVPLDGDHQGCGCCEGCNPS
jgi:hypothetical protein